MLYLTSEYDPHCKAVPLEDGYILIWTEEDIIDFYYDFWYKKCKERHLSDNFCTKKECIQAWAATNWALIIDEKDLQAHIEENSDDTFLTYKEWREKK